MIGAIFDKVVGGVGLASGLAESIIGGVKSAKAAKAQKKLIQAQRNKNDAWYNKNYYQDYLNRSDSQAAIRRVEDFMKKRNKNAAATATVMGSTPEVVAAQQQNDQKLMADTMGNIAANADVYKDRVQARYQQQDNALTGAQIEQAQLDELGGVQLAANGMSQINGSLNTLKEAFDTKKSNNNSNNTSNNTSGSNAAGASATFQTNPLAATPIPYIKVEKPKYPTKFGE